MHGRGVWTLAGLMAALLAGGLMLPSCASAATGGSPMPAGFLGLPSLHSIIQAIADGFFGALAGALVPGWLKHGTVGTIQHLVALPDPASWSHVGQLQGEMTYLGAMLLPVTLAVGAVRYWLVGLTGTAHPASAVVRCAGVTGVLVAYRWIVEQTVAATNTLTHGILGLPAVAGGLQRIIGVLFGGALLSGAGGVFGAFLVIIGVVFAAGLFAAQVLMTVVLAVLVVAGPPMIAISAIPELSHLARSWADALLAVALVPLGWTLLFATAGALCLDATSFTGASGGLPGHVAAAFAGLITFVLAVKLPLMMLGEIRHIFSRQSLKVGASTQQASRMPGNERVRAAHARLRAVGLEGVPSLGRSVGRAAGALGAPREGPLGAAGRGLAAAARRSGILAGGAGAAGGSAAALAGAGRLRGTGTGTGTGGRRGVRERIGDARTILAAAPREAITAVKVGSRRSRSTQVRPVAKATRTGGGADRAGVEGEGQRAHGASTPRPSSRKSPAPRSAPTDTATPAQAPAANRPRPAAVRAASQARSVAAPAPSTASKEPGGHTWPTTPRPPETQSAGKPAAATPHRGSRPPRPAGGSGAAGSHPAGREPSRPPHPGPSAPDPDVQRGRGLGRGKPRPRSRP